ncbi:MAG: alanine--glyoxylate aminotransferase family protein [Candidatus Aminicenantaceae bacterium]
MIKKHYLLSPGPTPIPEGVLAAATHPMIHHRTPDFSRIFMDTVTGIKNIFQTKNDMFILASSGSGAMEAAVVNTLSPEDSTIVINGGKFGSRWAKICRAYGVSVREIVLEWGEPYTKEQLSEEMKKNPDIKAVFSTLAETSTGTAYDIRGYGEILTRSDAILVVDGISGIGATPCPMDKWNLDVLLSASQKSFMVPPGLAYISFSQKAWSLVEQSTLPKFYFDAKETKNSLNKETSPWTPAISLIIQQQEALKIINHIGLNNLITHHRILGEATRAGIQSIGLELLSKRPANILTAVKIPSGIDGKTLVKTMQEKYKAYIAGAQDPHKGEFFRIAHLGYMDGFDILTALSALEMALEDMGYSFQKGVSVCTAKEILKENWE